MALSHELYARHVRAAALEQSAERLSAAPSSVGVGQPTDSEEKERRATIFFFWILHVEKWLIVKSLKELNNKKKAWENLSQFAQ